MCVNSFTICNQEMQSLGTGIYLAASIIDHSCQPNAVATFQGTTIQIRSIQRIPSFDWSKVLISYTDTLNTIRNIQEELQSTYYFLCQCPRCLDSDHLSFMTAALCPNSKCKEVLTLDRSKCKKCDEDISDDFIRRFEEVTEFTEMHLQNMKNIACILSYVITNPAKKSKFVNFWT